MKSLIFKENPKYSIPPSMLAAGFFRCLLLFTSSSRAEKAPLRSNFFSSTSVLPSLSLARAYSENCLIFYLSSLGGLSSS